LLLSNSEPIREEDTGDAILSLRKDAGGFIHEAIG